MTDCPAAFEPPASFDDAVQSDGAAKDWTPPGERLTTYSIGDKDFEIWHASLTDPAVQQILQRAQVFVPLLIEGGTYIDLEDPEWSLERWRIYFL